MSGLRHILAGEAIPGTCGRRPTRVLLAAVAAVVLTAAPSVLAQAAKAPSATIRLKEGVRDVLLAGRRDGKVFCANPEAPQVVTGIDPAKIEAITVRIEYDMEQYRKALIAQKWAEAAAVVFRELIPAIPYLDLPYNNLTPLGMEAGGLLMRAAAGNAAADAPEAARQESARQYAAARAVMAQVGRAAWFPGAEEARMRAMLCLIGMGKVEEAQAELDAAPVPEEASDAFGWHALVRARLLAHAGKWAEAMEAACESLAFQTKDIDSFPEALLLSATAYEQLGEWYRARDVHYEIARLFKGTPWQRVSLGRLRFIMAQKSTEAGEDMTVDQVFFGDKDDINEKVNELLGKEPSESAGTPAPSKEGQAEP